MDALRKDLHKMEMARKEASIRVREPTHLSEPPEKISFNPLGPH